MKKIIALLLVLAMAFGLVACGGSEAPAATEAPKADAPAAEAPAAPAAPAEKTEVTVIAAQYGTQTADWWAGFEEKFEAANGDIELVVEVVSWNDINAVVDTRVANGQAPDLLNIDAYTKYYESDLLLPASEWVSEETYAKFYEAFLAESMDAEGTVWAVPDLASARALYVNTDILATAGVEIPTTWAELRTACEAIKAACPDVYPWGVDMTTDEGQAAFAYYTWNNGGGFVNDNREWVLNSAENVEAMNYIVGLYNDGLTNSDPANDTRYALQDLFAAGKLAMMIGPTQIETVVKDAGGAVNFESALIPANEGKANASMGVMDRFMCFKQDGRSDAELAAITKVIDAFYDDEPYAEWVLMEGFIPATSTGGDLCIAADPAMEKWVNLVAGAKFYPSIEGWNDVKFGVIDAQQRILLGEDAQAVLDELQEEIVG